MASTFPVLLLLLFAGFWTTTLADDDCKSYFNSKGIFVPSIDCRYSQYCCGTCENRYCCSKPWEKLSEEKQEACFFANDNKFIAVGVTVAGIVIFIIIFIVCCVCPCCCIYKMCRKPRPVGTAATTTVITSQYPQQPVVQGGQYPPYQVMPTPAGYGATPMPTAPYQGQPYAAGPPPPYHEAGGPGYPVPYSQAAYDGGQTPYPIQPPVQPGFAHPPPSTDYNSTQPAYNPAYVEPPKTGY